MFWTFTLTSSSSLLAFHPPPSCWTHNLYQGYLYHFPYLGLHGGYHLFITGVTQVADCWAGMYSPNYQFLLAGVLCLGCGRRVVADVTQLLD
jgi:hypothetical protein